LRLVALPIFSRCLIPLPFGASRYIERIEKIERIERIERIEKIGILRQRPFAAFA